MFSLTPQERRIVAIALHFSPGYAPYPFLGKVMWPQALPENAIHYLRVNVSRIRRKVGHLAIQVIKNGGVLVNSSLLPENMLREAQVELIAMTKLMERADIDPASAIYSMHPVYRSSGPPVKRTSRRGQWTCLKQPGGCSCRCHRIQKGVQSRTSSEGAYQGKRHDRWSAEEDRFLIWLWEDTYWLPDVVVRHNEQFQHERTIHAMRHRLSDLGRSTREGTRSVTEISQALGIRTNQVEMLLAAGELESRRHWSSGWRVILESDLLALVRRTDLDIDPNKIRDPRLERERRIALIEARRQQMGRDDRSQESGGKPDPGRSHVDDPTAPRDRAAASRP